MGNGYKHSQTILRKYMYVDELGQFSSFLDIDHVSMGKVWLLVIAQSTP